jgi:hypothetical protein
MNLLTEWEKTLIEMSLEDALRGWIQDEADHKAKNQVPLIAADTVRQSIESILVKIQQISPEKK